jgi:choline/glycine/proline betaine transport protein
VKLLSTWNIALAFALMAFVFAVGPTGFLLDTLVQNVGEYLQRLPEHSFWTAAYDRRAPREAHEWLTGNTIFYWAWWIAWAPFVGMFIARISRGRTIRELVVGSLLGPSVAGMVWLTIFGDSALYQELFVDGGMVDAVSADVSTAIYVLLSRLPATTLTSIVCTVCVVLFFVTSSDSASLVVDTIASGGAHNPPVWQRVFWACLEGAVAGALLVGGGLEALQTAALCTALPFCVVVILSAWGLARALASERRRPNVLTQDTS